MLLILFSHSFFYKNYKLFRYIIFLPSYHVWRFYQMFSCYIIWITILISDNYFLITCHLAPKLKPCILDCAVDCLFFSLLAIVILHLRIPISVSIRIDYVILMWQIVSKFQWPKTTKVYPLLMLHLHDESAKRVLVVDTQRPRFTAATIFIAACHAGEKELWRILNCQLNSSSRKVPFIYNSTRTKYMVPPHPAIKGPECPILLYA